MVLSCWPDNKSVVVWMVVLACWRDVELVTEGTTVLACWRDDELAVGQMLVPRHRWPSLACSCNGDLDGTDDGASALLAIPCSLALGQDGNGADDGAFTGATTSW